MKSGIQGVRSSVGSDQCAKIFVWNLLPAVLSSVWQRHSWHGLLLMAPYLNKGNHDVVVIDRGSPPWSPWSPRSRASSWTFSPTSIFHKSPPQHAVTFLHLCLKPEITFDTKSLLYEHLYRVFWLFTNPANGCLLTAIHPLPFSMTNIAMYSKRWPVSIIYRIVVSISHNDNVMDFRDGLSSILPHSAFRMGISQVCKVISFACWSFAAFKAHLRRFRACLSCFDICFSWVGS